MFTVCCTVNAEFLQRFNFFMFRIFILETNTAKIRIHIVIENLIPVFTCLYYDTVRDMWTQY